MASASRLLPPVPPPAAQLRGRRDRLAVPRLRCRAAAAASASATDGAVLLERGGPAAVAVREFVTLDELRAAVRLRVRTFYEYAVDSVGTEDYRKALADREFEALQDRISGKMINFQRVSCINGTVPLSPSLMSAEELCSTCKFVEDGEERVVVGSLDLNQCLWLPDELTGKRPGVNEDIQTRAYLSNVCVAKELQKKGLGYTLVDKSKKLAREWGITDLYVHVAIDNIAGQKLYEKSGFVYEGEEPAWKARFLGRPRRLLLWLDMSKVPL
ncbi:GCN5-related N-acetyltransferase 7, chloroplastic-like isoform X1 [Miscanthus floridulus]|uniref:GCN5-related N-acetyltransferase 7, chloroplastic-like isoform X1 n=1 Tax=Miscanthus floridulus TaxID=154761 RepID=UPI00345B40AB